jgi:hypothetical protein
LAIAIGVIFAVKPLEELPTGLIRGFLFFRINLAVAIGIKAFEDFCAFIAVLAGLGEETRSGIE